MSKEMSKEIEALKKTLNELSEHIREKKKEKGFGANKDYFALQIELFQCKFDLEKLTDPSSNLLQSYQKSLDSWMDLLLIAMKQQSQNVVCPMCSNRTSSLSNSLINKSLPSVTRAKTGYSVPYIESPSISDATKKELKCVEDTYFITYGTFYDYGDFIGCFNMGVDLIGIDIPKYDWGVENGEKPYEVPSYPTIFKHIEENLLPESYTCQVGYKFITVEVPSRPFYMCVGRVDGVVCDPNYELSPATSSISFEIKRDLNEANESQSTMELIGMIIRSQRPVLHILTDMDTFTFMICQVHDLGNAIYKYTSQCYRECKAIIANWIKYAADMNTYVDSQDNRFHIKRIVCEVERLIKNPNIKPQYFNVNPVKKEKTFCNSDLSSKELEELNQLEDLFLSEEKHNVVSDKNRSGPVFRLTQQNTSLAMKLCYSYALDHDCKLVIYDLINEKSIYDKLKGKQGPWPKLIYGGYIFNFNFYAIVTEFVKGRHPEQDNEDDFKICYKSLKKLHKRGIIHGDARPPNFIISDKNEAYILDFGFSTLMSAEMKKQIREDVEKMKSKNAFNIDINENEI